MEGRLTPAEVGRDYERYVGYVYERDGWHVQYRGILRGTADLGIDLVCWNDTSVHVVQCKRWSVGKLIDEAVIAKLIEAASAYKQRRIGSEQLTFDIPVVRERTVRPVLFTTSSLSAEAAILLKQHNGGLRERYAL